MGSAPEPLRVPGVQCSVNILQIIQATKLNEIKIELGLSVDIATQK